MDGLPMYLVFTPMHFSVEIIYQDQTIDKSLPFHGQAGNEVVGIVLLVVLCLHLTLQVTLLHQSIDR